MQTVRWDVWYKDCYPPVSWVRVKVGVRVRVEIAVGVRVPKLNPNRMYVTGGKCPRGLSVLEPVCIDTVLCRSVSTANLRPHFEF